MRPPERGVVVSKMKPSDYAKMNIMQVNNRYSEYSLKTMELKAYEIKDGQDDSATPLLYPGEHDRIARLFSDIMCRLLDQSPSKEELEKFLCWSEDVQANCKPI